MTLHGLHSLLHSVLGVPGCLFVSISNVYMPGK